MSAAKRNQGAAGAEQRATAINAAEANRSQTFAAETADLFRSGSHHSGKKCPPFIKRKNITAGRRVRDEAFWNFDVVMVFDEVLEMKLYTRGE